MFEVFKAQLAERFKTAGTPVRLFLSVVLLPTKGILYLPRIYILSKCTFGRTLVGHDMTVYIPHTLLTEIRRVSCNSETIFGDFSKILPDLSRLTPPPPPRSPLQLWYLCTPQSGDLVHLGYPQWKRRATDAMTLRGRHLESNWPT